MTHSHLENCDTLPFEEALSQLESLIEVMEEQRTPLADLLKHYERASHLIARCEGLLHSARSQLEILNTPAKAPLESQPIEHTLDNDEISLF